MYLRKRPALTLPEILIALAVVAVIVPAALGGFGTVFAAGLRINERAVKASMAEWWFNSLEQPLYLPALSGAASADERGRMRFSWTTEPAGDGAVRVTLSVTNGAPSDVPLTVSRVY